MADRRLICRCGNRPFPEKPITGFAELPDLYPQLQLPHCRSDGLVDDLEIEVNGDIGEVEKAGGRVAVKSRVHLGRTVQTHSPPMGLHRDVQRGLAGLGLSNLDVIGEIKCLVVATEDEPSQRNPLSVPVLDEIPATALLNRELRHKPAFRPFRRLDQIARVIPNERHVKRST